MTRISISLAFSDRVCNTIQLISFTNINRSASAPRVDHAAARRMANCQIKGHAQTSGTHRVSVSADEVLRYTSQKATAGDHAALAEHGDGEAGPLVLNTLGSVRVTACRHAQAQEHRVEIGEVAIVPF
jgi:hypothetical protein